MATEHRPVPLPGQQSAPGGGPARLPLPKGAKAWSRAYLDERDQPARSEFPVPVDEDGRRTPHVRHVCPHKDKAGGGNMAKIPCGMEMWLGPDSKPKHCPEHGDQLLPDGGKTARDPLIPWGELVAPVKRAAKPVLALAAELVAGIVAHQGHVPALDLLAAGVALAGGGYIGVRTYLTRTRDKVHRETIRRRARVAAYLGGAAGAWLAWFAAVDPHSPVGLAALAALPAAWAIGSHTWRRYVEADQNRPLKPEPIGKPVEGERHGPEAPTDLQAKAAEYANQWKADSQIPNSRLDTETFKTTECGWQMVVVATKRGALSNLGGESIEATIRKVAACFDVPRSAVTWIEEWDDNPNRALLLVQPDNPLHETIPGEPVDILNIDNAVAPMGKRIDAARLGTILFKPGWGAPSRLVIGTKGSGKTELLKRLLMAMLRARVLNKQGQPIRLVAPFLHDPPPKRGSDYGAFRRLVCGFSAESDSLHMIVDAIAREMERRYDMLAGQVWHDSKGRPREGEQPWDPITMGPVISLVLDEFHINAKEEALLAKLDPFSRTMRGAGIEVVVATHGSTIEDIGKQVIRDMLAGGEAWLLRTTLGLNKQLATGGQLTGDPRCLPRIPGMLYQAAGEDATMMARAAYDEGDALYDMLYDDANVPRIQPVEWPRETLDAFGPEFVGWMNASQTRPLGSPLPEVPDALKQANLKDRQALPVGVFGDPNAGADTGLRAILFNAAGPITRKQIEDNPLWRWKATRLTQVLRQGQDEGWIIRHAIGQGAFTLSPAMRGELGDESETAA